MTASVSADGLRLVANPGGEAGTAGWPEARFEVADAGDFEKDQAFSFGAWIKLPEAGMTGSVIARMDNTDGYRGWDLWLEENRVATHIVHKWPDDALKVVARRAAQPGVWTHVLVTYDGSAKAAGVKIYINGEPQATDVAADALQEHDPHRRCRSRSASGRARTRLDGVIVHGLADLRPRPRAARGRSARLGRPHRGARPDTRRQAARTASGTRPSPGGSASVDPAAQELQVKLVGARGGASRHQGSGHVRPRDARAEPSRRWRICSTGASTTSAATRSSRTRPTSLPPLPADLPRNRLGLAQWLVRPEHPLTARVTVNRFWQEVFGTGLVRTTGDFGVTGELPSHPELLDWLAVEFRESGWDMKRLFRLMVESATYRQSAATTPEKLEKDPQNRLLSRGPRFRMDAEMIRDYALAASGLLVGKLGGPSVRPYQPEGVWEAVAMPESNTHFYAPTTAKSSTAAASTRSGSAVRRRPRWTSSTPRAARSAPSAASGPTRRCRPW